MSVKSALARALSPTSLILLLLRDSSVRLDRIEEELRILHPIGPSSLSSGWMSGYLGLVWRGPEVKELRAVASFNDLSCIFIV
jgi:hypothetical protein